MTQDGGRPRGPDPSADVRGRPVLELLVVGPALLAAPPALRAFAALTLLAAPSTWKLRDRLIRLLPEEGAHDGRHQ